MGLYKIVRSADCLLEIGRQNQAKITLHPFLLKNLPVVFSNSSNKMIPGVFITPLRLVLGTLYPAYASYKAVRTKDVKEYVKWMMYWIVFAIFTSVETFADIFVAFWFPFYYEVKILLLIWLISPVSRGSLGSSILYRRFVHPSLIAREEEIDRMILRLQEQGYNTVTKLAVKAFNYASNMIMQTAIRAPVLMNEFMEAQRQQQNDPQRSVHRSI